MAVEGALVTVDTNVVDPVLPFVIPFDSAAYDTDSIWSAGSPTRLTVPSGYEFVRIGVGIALINFAGGQVQAYSVVVTKNGVDVYTGRVGCSNTPVVINPIGSSVGPPIPVVAGDYFECRFDCDDSTVTIEGSGSTWFSMERIIL